MPLQVTPVNRNLQTRVTFMLLELEDLFVVLGAAAVMNVLGHFVGGEIAGMPTNLVLQYGVPLLMVPVLMAFKYGKPRGYVRDLAFWYMKPHAYCAVARDREIRSAYLREEQSATHPRTTRAKTPRPGIVRATPGPRLPGQRCRPH